MRKAKPSRPTPTLAIALGSLLAVALPGPRRAEACGGFFCNQATDPFNLPVAQTAENVLFAMDRDPSGQFQLEAHIQIFYTGPVDRFSWVVPVDNQPTLDVGQNSIFTALLGATEPRFEVEFKDVGTCRPSAYALPGGGSASSASGAADAASGPKSGDAGVDLAFRGEVGPYDAVVIKSTNPDDPKPLIDWLNTNRYFVTPAAERLIADYVRENKYFVAIKLQPQKGLNEIQPLVMRFLGPGPCVPIKLTSIAALNDLKINLWVLADHRVVPENFFEIEVSPASIDWFNAGANYAELVKRAANEASGNAFVTEYAGPTTMLRGQIFRPGRYNVDHARAVKTPPEALDAVVRGGFPRDGILLEVLRDHIPLPDALKETGIDERTFYNNIAQYWAESPQLFKPFDAQKFAAALEDKFITGPRKAQELIDKHAKLTRLSTFISPEEMTVDPTFVMNPSLPDVPAVRRLIAERHCGNSSYDVCTAPVKLNLPDGQGIWFVPKPQGYPCYGYVPGSAYERAGLDDLPALYRGYQRSADGEGLARFDNDAMIRAALAKRNQSLVAGSRSGVPTPPSPPPNPQEPGVTAASGGCACATAGMAGAPAMLFPLLFALALIASRRRS